MVVPLAPLLVVVAADVTAVAIGAAVYPSALNPVDPVVVHSFRQVGWSLFSSSFSSSSSSSLSYSSHLTASFIFPVIIPAEAEPVGKG